MIEIRPDQMQMFQASESAAFVRRALAYLREMHAEAVSGMSDAALEEDVRRQLAVAAGYGIHTEAAVIHFVELSLVYGKDFHCSWKYPEAERILSSEGDGAMKISGLLKAAREGFARLT